MEAKTTRNVKKNKHNFTSDIGNNFAMTIRRKIISFC